MVALSLDVESLKLSLPYVGAVLMAALLLQMGLFSKKWSAKGKVVCTSHSSSRTLTVGQTCVVTGGSQGLGLSVAKLLARKGANVVIVARNVDKLKAAVEELEVRSSFPPRVILLTSNRKSDRPNNSDLPTSRSNSTAWLERREPPSLHGSRITVLRQTRFSCARGLRLRCFSSRLRRRIW